MLRAPIHDLTPAETRRIAAAAVVLGFPLVLSDIVRRTHPLSDNKLVRLPGAASTVAPGLQDDDALTVGSSIWLDVSRGPVVADIPMAHGHHLSMTLYDPWAQPIPPLAREWALRPGARLAVIGADWPAPLAEATCVRRLPGVSAWLVTRVTPRLDADHEHCRLLLSQQTVTAGDQPWPPRADLAIEPPLRSAVEIALGLEPKKFLHRLSMLIARHPPPDAATEQGLARLGIVAGTPYRGLRDDSWFEQAVSLGFRDGRDEIAAAVAARLRPAQGWRALHAPPPDAQPLARAAAAAASLGAPALSDVLSLICDCDAEGRPLRGSERYAMRFPPSGAPPVEAFWSLGLRSPHRSRDLAMGRKSLGDREPLVSAPDGGLEILIQHSAPPSDVAANWLPAPPGEFTLVLRLYWPDPSALNGCWSPPQVILLDQASASERRRQAKS